MCSHVTQCCVIYRSLYEFCVEYVILLYRFKAYIRTEYVPSYDSFRSGLIQTKPRVYTFSLYSLYHCSCVVVKRFTEEDDVWFLL